MAPPIDDSMPARIPPTCPDPTRTILQHAWSHDLPTLKTLLNEQGKASAQDPTTGETPLHAAIRACGPAEDDNGDDGEDEDGCVEEAREVVQELFFSGAIWNDVDGNNETPGCVALRLGRKKLYEMCVDAGVRAEMLFALMDEYEQLSSGSEADEEENEEEAEKAGEQDKASDGETKGDEEMQDNKDAGGPGQKGEEATFIPPDANEKPVTSETYLQSNLFYDADKLVDSELNGVMMAWETDIMKRSVAALLPGDDPSGKRIINIGFGMGIVDRMFRDTKPSRHHIIEAHPSVLEHLSGPDSDFGSSWESSGPEQGAYKIHAGKWQDVVPRLLESGEQYDAIYFDTFGEDYSQLRMFMMEHIPGLMDMEGRFSFFNGLGADRQICYDVYTKVVEMHSTDAGLDIEWEESSVDMSAMAEEGKGEWEGVRRRYWTLNRYQPCYRP